jgi:hypothetical protein
MKHTIMIEVDIEGFQDLESKEGEIVVDEKDLVDRIRSSLDHVLCDIIPEYVIEDYYPEDWDYMHEIASSFIIKVDGVNVDSPHYKPRCGGRCV